MPNNIETKLTVTGPDAKIQEFIDTCMVEKEKKDYDGKVVIDSLTGEPEMLTLFDFNKIIPMPKSMHITSGSNTDRAIIIIKAKNGDTSGLAKYRDYSWVKEELGEDASDDKIIKLLEDRTDEGAMKEGQIALDNIEKHGSKDWYAWAIKNWGTKWGAYDYNEGERIDGLFSFSYSTAWSPASPVISKLGEMFPELTFINAYMDEGWGYYGEHTVCGEEETDEGFSESCNDPDFFEFANSTFGYKFELCRECGEAHNPDWTEYDGTLCYDCQEKANEEKEEKA